MAPPKYPPVVHDERVYLSPIPRLFVYDHCPYCVRARMIFGLKKIKVDVIFVANDDFEQPISLIGKKMTPILEFAHHGRKEVMPESLDIIKRVDEGVDFEAGPPLLKPSKKQKEIEEILVGFPPFSFLTYVRVPQLEILGEFVSKEARETFKVRHPLPNNMTYEEALAKTSEYLPQAIDRLKKVEGLLDTEEFVNADGPSYDDIFLFPRLRGLTLVKGMEFTVKVSKYIENMSRRCDIPTFTRFAV